MTRQPGPRRAAPATRRQVRTGGPMHSHRPSPRPRPAAPCRGRCTETGAGPGSSCPPPAGRGTGRPAPCRPARPRLAGGHCRCRASHYVITSRRRRTTRSGRPGCPQGQPGMAKRAVSRRHPAVAQTQQLNDAMTQPAPPATTENAIRKRRHPLSDRQGSLAMKLTSRPGRRLAAGIALACSAIRAAGPHVRL
jgi:hypothetical protein